MERENISLYLEGCYKLGLSGDYMFLPPDLHSRTNIAAVLNNLIALSDIANYFGFVQVRSLRTGDIPDNRPNSAKAAAGSVLGSPAKPKAAPKKWTVPIPTGPTYVGQLDGNSDPEYVITQLRKELEAAQIKVSTLEYSNGLLKDDLKAARSKNRTSDLTAAQPDADLREQIRRLKMDKMKLIVENESLRKLARARGVVKGAVDPQQKIISACKELKGLVISMLNPEHQVRKEHCFFLEEWFKTEDAMRRTFASVLRETIFEKNKGQEVELTSASYEALVYLITCLLDHCNPQNGADVISGKYVLQCSYLVYHKPSLFTKTWCQEDIKAHSFWTDIVFWEEYFWHKMATNHPNLTDNRVLLDELKTFAPTVILWGQNTAESIVSLFQNIYHKIDLQHEQPDDATLAAIVADITEIARKQKSYVRSTTGLNIRNVLWGVVAASIEAPLQDLKLEITADKLTSLSSSSKPQSQQSASSSTKPQPQSQQSASSSGSSNTPARRPDTKSKPSPASTYTR